MADIKTATITQDDNGCYRTYNGTTIYTDCNGDVFITTTIEEFDVELSDDIKDTFSELFPSLNSPDTVDDLISDKWVVFNDDENVCFKTGVYNSSGSRLNKTSDFEFEFFMGLFASDDLSNISSINPYQVDIE